MQKSDGGKGREKKLSWAYRNKKRILKNKRVEEAPEDTTNVQVQNKKARIVLRNLPFKVTEDDIKKHYAPYGEIEEINLLRHPGGKLVGCGFVQFKKVEQASKAIFNTNKKELLGRIIASDWAIPKYKFAEGIKDDVDKTEDVTDKTESNTEANTQNEESTSLSKTQLKKNLKKKKRDKDKLKNVQKRARIIVRNLSFNITDDSLKEHFAPFGNVEEVKILTRPDGKLVGCGFVQYSNVQSAAKAIHHLNLKPLLGRPIVVDWAVPKTKFGKANEQKDSNEAAIEEVEIKKEEPDEDDSGLDKDPDQSDRFSKLEADQSNDGESEDEKPINSSIEDEIVVKEDEDDDEDEDEDEDEDKVEVKISLDEVNDEKFEEDEASRPRRISNDVNEGKTVFLKNVPFSATNDDLRKCMEQFGPVYYALVCMDPLTEHSKGTAFVKFQHMEDAEKCLSAGTELRIHDQTLDPHKALNRNEVQDKSELKKQKVTDSRNLYLVKEGVILASSPAAVGVSAGDMARRLQLEQWKSQMLRNLNMFVSRVRLVVHNLPISVDDKKLREIFQNHSGPKAVIREARVMRDLRNIEANGIGRSKEYGFVAFTSHEDALKALRSINNNPKIFGPTKRPIVAFSIENRVMVNAIKKRVEKSRERNPLWTGSKLKTKNDRPMTNKRKYEDEKPSDNKKTNITDRPTVNNRNKDRRPAKHARLENGNNEGDVQPYSGIASKPGERKMRSRFNLKSQAILHNQNLKRELKNKKSKAKIQQTKKEQRISQKEIRPKQGSKRKANKEDINFSKLVNNYKNKLMATPKEKSKWYET
ncbi:RNA-binding protein 28 [Diprion similis]|uniref:RNA-binding protein 28 n=1 Tax=Diprion similis TaxID=362088 RepID=UPI001EF92DE9|nr:RNA-binding protein 28 [Diprion similis]